MAENPKLIFLVTEDWYFWSHRLPMARAAQALGFDVAVATRVAAHGERIGAAGFRLHPLGWKRRSFGLGNLAAVRDIWRLYRRERPAIVHHVALKPAVLGYFAAAAAGVPAIVTSHTGAGFAFATDRLARRLLRGAILAVLRRLVTRRGSRVIVQNADDRAMLGALSPRAERNLVLIRGSGIDTDRHAPLPEPAGPVTVAYVGRMIEPKGVRLLVAAQQRLVESGLDLRLVLAGASDADNPEAIAEAELRQWQTLPGITWLGHCADIRAVWERAHIAALLSEREGLPMSLLEAAAMGRPIVASDVPGCREIARPGLNALLVPRGDEAALAAALARLAGDVELRRRYGAASRRLVESDLSATAVGEATAAVYRELLRERG
jgi:glycosyltransferase involved in cell wall biosynthesis